MYSQGVDIKAWCDNINRFMEIINPGRGYITESNLNRVFKGRIKLIQNPQQEKELAAALFWSVWIDQIMYFILVDKRFYGFPRNAGCYDKFRRLFSFPKLYENSGHSFLSPFVILDTCPCEAKLLLEDKKEFWEDEVAKWLVEEGYASVKENAERMFGLDLQERFPEGKYDFLW